MDVTRKIIHIDMDAFFASIEQRDNEAYRGKPLAVGYAGNRGVVAAASYEARRYGVHSALSSKVALRKCPSLIFAPPRFTVYKEVSKQIMNVFLEYTDLVEPLSLDEAYLDVTSNLKHITYATTIAREIKKKILEQTLLTASAGVSYNKFLAKIASDVNKPNGMFVITPDKVQDFMWQLPIEKFYGVGRVTAQKMKKMGINWGADLLNYDRMQLYSIFGKAGLAYYDFARGIDDRAVEPNRIRKSVGAEVTFDRDIDTYPELLVQLKSIADDLEQRITKNNFRGRTFTLKVKYADFSVVSRSKTYFSDLQQSDILYVAGEELLLKLDIAPKVRLLGISVKNTDSEFLHGAYQLSFHFKD